MKTTVTAIAAALAAAGVATAASPSLGASTTKVSVKDDKFVAKSVTVAKGATVRWVWKGTSPHNVTVVSGPATFRAGTRRKGHFAHTFSKAGTYRIICTIHAPDMRMTVKVR